MGTAVREEGAHTAFLRLGKGVRCGWVPRKGPALTPGTVGPWTASSLDLRGQSAGRRTRSSVSDVAFVVPTSWAGMKTRNWGGGNGTVWKGGRTEDAGRGARGQHAVGGSLAVGDGGTDVCGIST